MHAKQPSRIEVTVAEQVQLDRLVAATDRYLPERAGALLAPGTTSIALEPGFYFFKTLSDAHLKVVHGGVETTTKAQADGKDPWPQPPPRAEAWPAIPQMSGDEPAGDAPQLTVE